MSTLAEQISQLANPTPVFADPEDVQDDTGAKLLDRSAQDEDSSLTGSSKLRRQVAPLLAEGDARYAGRSVSRSKLVDQDMPDEEDESEVDEEDSDSDDVIKSDDDVIKSSDEDSESEEGEQQLADFREKLKMQKLKEQMSMEDDDDDDDDDEDESMDSGDDDQDEDEEDEEEMDEDADEAEVEEEEDEEDEKGGGVRSFSAASVDEEIQKGKAAKSQLGLWDSMLELRIKLQGILGLVNQLPQPATWRQFVEAGEDKFSQAVKDGQTGLWKVLEQLVRLQTTLLLQNPDTKLMASEGSKDTKQQKTPSKKLDDDDEEITSESDVASEGENEADGQRHRQLKRKIKMADYPEFLAKRHKDFQQYRNSTIQRWSDKTRIASGRLSKGFSAFEQSALKQIEQILSDKPRLIKRTQLKRSMYRVLGKEDIKQQKEEEAEEGGETRQESLPSRDHLKDYDEEIFDDDDFYHQLLRELIERKTSDLTDPVALGRQWLEVQKLRTKIKKKVDTRASKGRKIRYEIHPKLVNFLAPEDNSEWTDEQRDELFSSLFGKRLPGASSNNTLTNSTELTATGR